MIVELNPLKWRKHKPEPRPTAEEIQDACTAAPVSAVPQSDSARPIEGWATNAAQAEETSTMANKFVGLLETLGKDFEKGLVDAVKYLPAVGTLVSLIFPASAATVTTVTDAMTLIQNAVVAVEQKYAASGVQTGTGAQKLAEVLTLAQQAVSGLLTQAGVTADETYVTNLVNAVVAILSVQTAASVAAPAAAAA